LAWKIAGMYRISCERGKVYIGQTGHSTGTRIEEHHQHIRLYLPDISAMTEHSTDLGHSIQFQNTRILAMKTKTRGLHHKGAEKIELHPNNKEEGFSLSKAWNLLLQTLKK